MTFYSNGSEMDERITPPGGNCYLLCPLNSSERYQRLNLDYFSNFVDSGHARFNLSAYFSCPFLISSAYVRLGFYTKEELLTTTNYPKLSRVSFLVDNDFCFAFFQIGSEANKTFHRKYAQGTIPSNTRYVYISVGADKLQTNLSHLYCLIDLISLTVITQNPSNTLQ